MRVTEPDSKRSSASASARAFAALVGAGEAMGGLALVAHPRWALGVLGLTPPPQALVFLRWIGIFVLATGLAYLLPWTRPAGARRDVRLRAAIEWTSVARLLVASFVAFADLAGELPAGWCAVGAYDGVVACVQLAWLARGGFGP